MVPKALHNLACAILSYCTWDHIPLYIPQTLGFILVFLPKGKWHYGFEDLFMSFLLFPRVCIGRLLLFQVKGSLLRDTFLTLQQKVTTQQMSTFTRKPGTFLVVQWLRLLLPI